MSNNDIQSILDHLKTITDDVVGRLNTINEEEFEQFTEERDAAVNNLLNYRDLLDSEHKVQIQSLLVYDQQILDRMHALKDEAGQWLENKGAVRIQHQAYHKTYSPDSWFVDYRK